ncbi:MAG: hypothetical protein NC452_18670 [Eubacterium sp.]|nr:hypothetical protein [Eubacterium sp.]
MNMKKLIAGVAATALTATSLAVVNVSAADTTKTFNFVGSAGSMTVTYEQTVSFRGGIEPSEVFTKTAAGYKDSYSFDYDLKLSMKSGYKDDNLGDANNIMATVKTGSGTKFTVVGYNEITEKDVTSRATAKVSDDKTKETIRVANDEVVLPGDMIDLTDMDLIKSITVSNTFNINTKGVYVPEGACNLSVKNNIGLVVDDLLNGSGSYKSEKGEGDGKLLTTNAIFTFEGAEGDKTLVVDNANGWNEARQYGTSLGHNLLRWTNDNIVQNRGAKLRITFMKPDELKAAIESNNQTYPTLPYDWAKWQGNLVLEPVASDSEYGSDIFIGVNLQNTSRLQQGAKIENYVAEFDWDTLVQNSASTVSGNVDSIAIRVRNTQNVVDNLTTGGTAGSDGYYDIAIKQIDIVIPDQTTVPAPTTSDATRILTAGSSDNFVKVIGTDATIFGNGAQELSVENNITNNSVSYSLKLTDANGAYCQPAGELTLQLSIPSDFQGLNLTSDTVKHTCNDGSVEDLKIQNMDTYKTDKYVVVKTSKFSSFEFGFETEATETEAPVEETTTAAETTEAPAEETTAAPAGATSGNATDKNAPTGVVLAVVPAAIAAAAVVISKKRK